MPHHQPAHFTLIQLIHPRLILPLIALTLTSCADRETAPPSATIDFASQIKPILENRCINCHHAGALMGHLNLQSAEQASAERPTGPVIQPGNPDQSPFYIVLTLPVEDQKAMPPESHRIPAEEAALIKRWIEEGATWPSGPEGAIKPLPPLTK
jgi:hypothetical protein